MASLRNSQQINLDTKVYEQNQAHPLCNQNSFIFSLSELNLQQIQCLFFLMEITK